MVKIDKRKLNRKLSRLNKKADVQREEGGLVGIASRPHNSINLNGMRPAEFKKRFDNGEPCVVLYPDYARRVLEKLDPESKEYKLLNNLVEEARKYE